MEPTIEEGLPSPATATDGHDRARRFRKGFHLSVAPGQELDLQDLHQQSVPLGMSWSLSKNFQLRRP